MELKGLFMCTAHDVRGFVCVALHVMFGLASILRVLHDMKYIPCTSQ